VDRDEPQLHQRVHAVIALALGFMFLDERPTLWTAVARC
jgi:hypothetical protein